MMVRAHAPGRVNLIGDHTDYTGGLVLPMAIDLGTTIEARRGGARVQLSSDAEPMPVDVEIGADPSTVEPPWGRYVAGVVSVLQPTDGLTGTVTTTLPVGAGLSSSAALEVAVALAVGFSGTPVELAQACQRAEQWASGVPCGLMDQLASAAGVGGHALLIDCTALTITPVPLPPGLDVVVVHSGESRQLAASAYAARRSSCEAAEALIGPLRQATAADVAGIADPETRRRAAHVVAENERVREFAAALAVADLGTLGQNMAASHASLRDLFEVSTPALDALVEQLATRPGVVGARMTGAGFGGCVVALAQPGALDGVGRVVRAAAGATVQRLE